MMNLPKFYVCEQCIRHQRLQGHSDTYLLGALTYYMLDNKINIKTINWRHQNYQLKNIIKNT